MPRAGTPQRGTAARDADGWGRLLPKHAGGRVQCWGVGTPIVDVHLLVLRLRLLQGERFVRHVLIKRALQSLAIGARFASGFAAQGAGARARHQAGLDRRGR